MKNYCFILLLISSTTLAQSKIVFGINLGSTFSNIRGNEAADQNKYDFNFLVGGSIEIPLNEKLSFLGNINYERNTFKRTMNVPVGDPFDPIFETEEGKIQIRLEYVTIPLNLKHYLGQQKKWYLNGGPFLGIFLGSNSKVNNENANENADSLFKTMNFGANLGLGTRLKINEKNNLNLEIRHNYGFSNISDVPIIDNGTVKTNSFNLIANWEFGL